MPLLVWLNALRCWAENRPDSARVFPGRLFSFIEYLLTGKQPEHRNSDREYMLEERIGLFCFMFLLGGITLKSGEACGSDRRFSKRPRKSHQESCLEALPLSSAVAFDSWVCEWRLLESGPDNPTRPIFGALEDYLFGSRSIGPAISPSDTVTHDDSCMIGREIFFFG